MSPRAALLGLAVLLIAGLLGVAFLRVAELERSELAFEGDWGSLSERLAHEGSTRISARLAEVRLRAGEQAVFEVCARGEMAREAWRDSLDFVVWAPERGKVELKVPLDEEHLELVRRSSRGACLKLGGGRIEHDGRYALDAVFHGKQPSQQVVDTPLRARVMARVPLSRREGALVLGVALCGMLALFTGFSRMTTASAKRGGSLTWALLGFGCALVLGLGALSVPLGGSVGGLSRGLALAVLEIGVGVAFALRLGPAREQLGLHAPARSPVVALAVAVVSAGLLNRAARWAMNVVPSTGEAPIETFISWPSGALAFAALGMVVPLAEELFFRGFVYGALEHRGKVFAFTATVLSFTAAHVQQAWGNWGALLAVAVTGAVLTALRAATGSTLVPAVAHLLYNFSLWLNAFG